MLAGAEDAPPSSPLHHLSQEKLIELVVVDRREVNMLKTQRTSALKQPPSSMVTIIIRRE
jgi:hypothetical protein